MSDPGVVDGGDEPDAGSGDDPLEEITVFLVLGAGFLALFAGFGFFWMIWVLGFAVLLPLVSVLSNHYGPFLGGGSGGTDRSRERDGAESALETLKERYARGEIDEAEFERRLERLVENENLSDVEGRLADRGTGGAGPAGDRERDRERSPEFEYES